MKIEVWQRVKRQIVGAGQGDIYPTHLEDDRSRICIGKAVGFETGDIGQRLVDPGLQFGKGGFGVGKAWHIRPRQACRRPRREIAGQLHLFGKVKHVGVKPRRQKGGMFDLAGIGMGLGLGQNLGHRGKGLGEGGNGAVHLDPVCKRGLG